VLQPQAAVVTEVAARRAGGRSFGHRQVRDGHARLYRDVAAHREYARAAFLRVAQQSRALCTRADDGDAPRDVELPEREPVVAGADEDRVAVPRAPQRRAHAGARQAFARTAVGGSRDRERVGCRHGRGDQQSGGGESQPASYG
jgi:hypothetical protein